jgi:hypothetical protein
MRESFEEVRGAKSAAAPDRVPLNAQARELVGYGRQSTAQRRLIDTDVICFIAVFPLTNFARLLAGR